MSLYWVDNDHRWSSASLPAVVKGRKLRRVVLSGEVVHALCLVKKTKSTPLDSIGLVATPNPEKGVKLTLLRVSSVLSNHGAFFDRLDPYTQGDVIEGPGDFALFWVQAELLPSESGVKEIRVSFCEKGFPGRCLGRSLELELECPGNLPPLPPPKDWSFFLDLWQNPFAVARVVGTQFWTKEHIEALRKHLKLLASVGQKCITTTIVTMPWGTQTTDPYSSMVLWKLKANGQWDYDFRDFDLWVSLCLEAGIDKCINAYSLLPWSEYGGGSERVDYTPSRYLVWSEKDQKYVTMRAHPMQPCYKDLWTPFLKAFVAHLREKKWLSMTYVAVDERPPAEMEVVVNLIREVAPELKIALAGHYHENLAPMIDDWSVLLSRSIPTHLLQKRRKSGFYTTFYVCCGPLRPNTFTESAPVESVWLGWYAASAGFDGMLRWAYDSWTMDPQDTRHGAWPAGDCFLCYPDARSSIRLERLREGIQEYEKLHFVFRALYKILGFPYDPSLPLLEQSIVGGGGVGDITMDGSSEEAQKVEEAYNEVFRSSKTAYDVTRRLGALRHVFKLRRALRFFQYPLPRPVTEKQAAAIVEAHTNEMDLSAAGESKGTIQSPPARFDLWRPPPASMFSDETSSESDDEDSETKTTQSENMVSIVSQLASQESTVESLPDGRLVLHGVNGGIDIKPPPIDVGMPTASVLSHVRPEFAVSMTVPNGELDIAKSGPMAETDDPMNGDSTPVPKDSTNLPNYSLLEELTGESETPAKPSPEPKDVDTGIASPGDVSYEETADVSAFGAAFREFELDTSAQWPSPVLFGPTGLPMPPRELNATDPVRFAVGAAKRSLNDALRFIATTLSSSLSPSEIQELWK